MYEKVTTKKAEVIRHENPSITDIIETSYSIN